MTQNLGSHEATEKRNKKSGERVRAKQKVFGSPSGRLSTKKVQLLGSVRFMVNIVR